MKKVLSLLVVALTAMAVYAAVTVTNLSLAEVTGFTANTTLSELEEPVTSGNYTFTFTQGNSATAPAYNANSSEVRLYGGSADVPEGNTMTITTTGADMTQIVLSDGSSFTWGDMAVNTGSVDFDAETRALTWTGEAKEVTFTVIRPAGSKATQFRFANCSITAGKESQAGELEDLTDKFVSSVGEPAEEMQVNTWYVLTQVRGGETPAYDTGAGNQLMRAAADQTVETLLAKDTPANDVKQYLIYFTEGDFDGTFQMHFATGNHWNGVKSDAEVASNYFFYRAESTNHPEIPGWAFNITEDGQTYGLRMDNNAAGNTVATWGSGKVIKDGNNVWKLYPVEFYVPSEEDLAQLQRNEAMAQHIATAKTTLAGAYVYTEGDPLITDPSQFFSPYTINDEQEVDDTPATDEQVYGFLLDGDPYTYWHSDWGSGNVANHLHYLQVEFDTPVEGVIEMAMARRMNMGNFCKNDNPIAMSVEASADGIDFELVAELDVPFTQTVDDPYVKATFNLKTPAKYLCFFNEHSNGGNDRGYWHCGEFQLYPTTLSSECAASTHAAAVAALEAALEAAQAVENATEADVTAIEEALAAYEKAISEEPEPKPAYEKVRLSFSEVEEAGNAVVTVTNEKGEVIEGATATLVSVQKHTGDNEPVATTLQPQNTDLLTPRYDNAENNGWILTFNVTGLEGKFKEANADLHAMNASGGYQADENIKYWDLTVSTDGEVFGVAERCDISNPIYQDGDIRHHEFSTTGAGEFTENMTLTVEVRKVQGGGCFCGLKYLEFVMGEGQTQPESEFTGVVTNSLAETTIESVEDLEGLQLTFDGAKSVEVRPEATIAVTDETGMEIYSVWAPEAGSTSNIEGNVVSLLNWMSFEEYMTAVQGKIEPQNVKRLVKRQAEEDVEYWYFEDHGSFIVDGNDDPEFLVELAPVAHKVVKEPETPTATIVAVFPNDNAHHVYVLDGKLTAGAEVPAGAITQFEVVSHEENTVVLKAGEQYIHWTSGDNTNKSADLDGLNEEFDETLNTLTLVPAGLTGCSTSAVWGKTEDDVQGLFRIQGMGTNGSVFDFTLRENDDQWIAGDPGNFFFDSNWDNNGCRTSFFQIEFSGDEPEGEFTGVVTSSLAEKTVKGIEDFEGMTLTFEGAKSVEVREDGYLIVTEDPEGAEMLYLWTPMFGGTSNVEGNVVTLTGWLTEEQFEEAMEQMGGGPSPYNAKRLVKRQAEEGEGTYVYMEDYGTFIVDGNDDPDFYVEFAPIAFEEEEPVEEFPAEGVAYIIKNVDAAMYLHVREHEKKAVLLSSEPQNLYFTKVEGGYTIATEEGLYVGGHSNTWNVASNVAETWTIEEVEGGYAFHCKQGYLGFDNLQEMSEDMGAAYRNKKVTDHGVFLIEKPKSAADLEYDQFVDLVKHAQDLVEANKVDVESIQYDQNENIVSVESPVAGKPGYKTMEAILKLVDTWDYYSAYVSTFDNAADLAAYLGMYEMTIAGLIEECKAELAEYDEAPICLPEAGKTYVIRNQPYTFVDEEYSYALAMKDGALTTSLDWQAEEVADELKWTASTVNFTYVNADLEEVTETRYQFTNVADPTQYISWKTLSTDNTADNTKWFISANECPAYGSLEFRTVADNNNYRVLVIDMRDGSFNQANGHCWGNTFSDWYYFTEVEGTTPAGEEYALNFDKDLSNKHASRKTNSVSITVEGETQTIEVADNTLVYNDMSEQTFTVAPGATVEPTIGYNGSWMHGYLYIDLDNNKKFDVEPGDAEAEELVSYTFYSAEDAGTGLNSAGETVSNNCNATELPSFVAPTTEGTYRMRYIVDWNCINPGGQYGDLYTNNFIDNNGGAVIDVTLVVAAVDGVGTVLRNDNTEAIYNLQGQRQAKSIRGLNIMGGKKVLVK